MPATPLLERLDGVLADVVAPAAPETDRLGQFPRAGIDALGAAGLLGLLSAEEVGGAGGSLADAAAVVRRLAATCGSTAMVVCMHYSAAAVIEQHGPLEVRRAVAAGRHLSTLAFSERGSRSHFWVPLGTATPADGGVSLDAQKSWVTSAGEADSYVWTSRASAGQGATLWLVPASSPGLAVGAPFDGIGLRGNGSVPVDAVDVRLPVEARLGPDGEGMDLALGLALPVFLVCNASCSLGFMDAALAKVLEHTSSARLEHLDQPLSGQPVVRQHLASMQNRADAASALVADAIAALASGRADAPLRMLQSKAVAGEAARCVLDEALQVGGGAAFRREVGLDRHFRDAQGAALMAPTTDALQDFIGRALSGLPLFD